MPTKALLLVLAAACIHAAWNLLANRVRGRMEVVWMVTHYFARGAFVYHALPALPSRQQCDSQRGLEIVFEAASADMAGTGLPAARFLVWNQKVHGKAGQAGRVGGDR